jgi:hypothetical protein
MSFEVSVHGFRFATEGPRLHGSPWVSPVRA